MEGIFLMKINEIVELLDLQKLHIHCIAVEYIKAMLFTFSQFSIYAY